MKKYLILISLIALIVESIFLINVTIEKNKLENFSNDQLNNALLSFKNSVKENNDILQKNNIGKQDINTLYTNFNTINHSIDVLKQIQLTTNHGHAGYYTQNTTLEIRGILAGFTDDTSLRSKKELQLINAVNQNIDQILSENIKTPPQFNVLDKDWIEVLHKIDQFTQKYQINDIKRIINSTN